LSASVAGELSFEAEFFSFFLFGLSLAHTLSPLINFSFFLSSQKGNGSLL